MPRHTDILARLRATDPARHTDLDDLDATVTTRMARRLVTEAAAPEALSGAPIARPRRRSRRGRNVIAGAVGLALLGGGAAYASYQTWYTGGGGDGLTCVNAWSDDLEQVQRNAVGGPELTGDPIADCQHYESLTERDPIRDPVAFRLPGHGSIYVAPSDQIPITAERLTAATVNDASTRELDSSMHDWVDGMVATCRTEEDARDFAKTELQRLHLVGWRILTSSVKSDEGPCVGDPEVDASTRTVTLLPHSMRSPDDRGASRETYTIRDALRGIAGQCLPLAKAERLTTEAMGTEFHWPLTVIDDPAATCTRVDMEVGGSIQITLRGPQVVAP